MQRKTWWSSWKEADRNEYQKRHVSRPWQRLEHKRSHFLRDLDLTGTDSSDNEVKKATTISANNNIINFIVDNILNSKIKEKEFDYILRDCFHAVNCRARIMSKKSKGY